MANLTNLANALLKLDDDLAACMRCGNCQAICPVFQESSREADVARGKLVLLQNLAYQLIKDPIAVEERLSRCLLCGSCQFNCSSGVKTLEIFLEARKILTTYKQLPWLKKVIFRFLLPRPKLFANIFQYSAKFQALFMRKQNNLQETSTIPMLSPFLGKRHLPNLSRVQFHQIVNHLDTRASYTKYNVILYPGCMLDKIYPQIGQAIYRIFREYNIGVYTPPDFACCGMPVLASGDEQGFQQLLQKNIDVFAELETDKFEYGFDYIISACPSCTETISHWWMEHGQVLDASRKKLLENISPKVIDIHKFLVDIVKVPLEELETTQEKAIPVVYHESCHMKKSLKLSLEVKKLIQDNSKYKLVEMEESDSCCGCGGSFTLFYPELSKNIGQKKRDNIVQSRAKCVVSACPACMLQLNDILARNNDEVEVKHSIEIFAEEIGIRK